MNHINKQKYVELSAGTNTLILVREDWTVEAFGTNEFGQCEVNDWTDIVKVYAGESHSLGLKKDGTLVASGLNDFYQCEVRDMINPVYDELTGKFVRNHISGGWRDIVSMCALNGQSLGVQKNGHVQFNGSVSDWEYAIGSDINKFGQEYIDSWREIVAISAGIDHVVGLKADLTVVAIGNPEYGTCDLNEWNEITEISAAGFYSMGLKKDGTVVAAGWNEYGQCDVSEWNDIIAISAGTFHSIGLKRDGTVVAAGWNAYGQCDVSQWNDIVKISAGLKNTYGLKKDGTVVCAGYDFRTMV